MSNLSAPIAIFDYLKSTDRNWTQALRSLIPLIQSWSDAKRSKPTENTAKLDLIRGNLALRKKAADIAMRESNERYFSDLVSVGNALVELGPGSSRTIKHRLVAVLGRDKIEELADRTQLAQNSVSGEIVRRELATMERRVKDVEDIFKINVWNLKTRSVFEELHASIMGILEKHIAEVRAEVTFFDLDMKYRKRVLEILAY